MHLQGNYLYMTSDKERIQLIGNSSSIKQVKELIRRVAHQSTTTLILGESGTGKELVARLLHQTSSRAQGPFIAINCAAIPLELLESELFGHEKGAFTGAIATRQGRFELAKGGTLFLDEIGDMPSTMQAKLLRVLQEKVFERVGGNRLINADVRVIAATHQNLQACVKRGTFREDLFYRLHIFPIEIAPLRERQGDIPVLISHFLEQSTQEADRIQFSKEAMDSLEAYSWPGNVRELINFVERMKILHPGEKLTSSQVEEHLSGFDRKHSDKKLMVIQSTELPEQNDFDLKEHLNEVELEYITQALKENNWVVTKAAKRLGLRRTTLVEKMKKFGIEKGILSQN